MLCFSHSTGLLKILPTFCARAAWMTRRYVWRSSVRPECDAPPAPAEPGRERAGAVCSGGTLGCGLATGLGAAAVTTATAAAAVAPGGAAAGAGGGAPAGASEAPGGLTKAGSGTAAGLHASWSSLSKSWLSSVAIRPWCDCGPLYLRRAPGPGGGAAR
jgi:hypothetical protein